ncbi:MAG: hypothetical protein IKQ25_08000 [Lachnospiraceae bacterium]|nr:hypothetical protein [Lachnospiraceae bacterium]
MSEIASAKIAMPIYKIKEKRENEYNLIITVSGKTTRKTTRALTRKTTRKTIRYFKTYDVKKGT